MQAQSLASTNPVAYADSVLMVVNTATLDNPLKFIKNAEDTLQVYTPEFNDDANGYRLYAAQRGRLKTQREALFVAQGGEVKASTSQRTRRKRLKGRDSCRKTRRKHGEGWYNYRHN